MPEFVVRICVHIDGMELRGVVMLSGCILLRLTLVRPVIGKET